jgi:hypothetical protein
MLTQRRDVPSIMDCVGPGGGSFAPHLHFRMPSLLETLSFPDPFAQTPLSVQLHLLVVCFLHAVSL